MKKILTFTLVSILFVGAGCTSSSVSNPASGMHAPSATAPTAQEDTSPSAAAVITPAKTDATWKTYANHALGFSFMTPTKGRLAPTWSVDFQPLTSEKIVDGCWETEKGTIKNHVMAGGQPFCHSRNFVRTSGDQITFVDQYVTKIKTSYVVIRFSKIAYDILEKSCAAQVNADFTTVKGSCAPIGESDYQTSLDSTIGTFSMNAP